MESTCVKRWRFFACKVGFLLQASTRSYEIRYGRPFPAKGACKSSNTNYTLTTATNFNSSGSFRTTGRWTSSARECHSPSFGHLSIAFVGQGENFSPWQQTLRLLWPFFRPLTFLSSFTLFDVLYTYSLIVGLFPSLPPSLSLSLSLSLSFFGEAS